METKYTKGEWRQHKNSNWIGIGTSCKRLLKFLTENTMLGTKQKKQLKKQLNDMVVSTTHPHIRFTNYNEWIKYIINQNRNKNEQTAK